MDAKPREITVHTNIDTFRKTHTPAGDEFTLVVETRRDPLTPAKESLPRGFFHHDVGINIYEAFFHPQIVEHEGRHLMMQGMYFALGQSYYGDKKTFTFNLENPTSFQMYLKVLGENIDATKDKELIAAYDTLLRHFAFDYYHTSSQLANPLRDKLSPAQFREFLIEPRNSFVANRVGDELFAWAALAKYPEWNRGAYRTLSDIEQKAFLHSSGHPTAPLVAKFLIMTNGYSEIQKMLDIRPHHFQRFLEYESNQKN